MSFSDVLHIGAARAATVAKVKPKPLRHLAYLNHYVGSLASPKALQPTSQDPGFDPSALDTTLQDELDQLMKDEKGLQKVPFALVDLTGGKPRFAGKNVFTPRYPASMGKVAAMLGALQLRFDLQVLADKSGVSSFQELADLARMLWGKSQVVADGASTVLLQAKQGKAPKFELQDRLVLLDGKKVPCAKYAAPQLERIFDTSSISPLRFRSTGEGFPELARFEYGNKVYKGHKLKRLRLDKLGFKERLDLMIGFSHNAASASCIRDVGYLFIASTLLQSGIYDPSRGGGLWLGSDYGGGRWRGDPISGQSAGATPASFARLFALLAQDRLIDADASQTARLLLFKGSATWSDPQADENAKPGAGTRSFFEDCLLKNTTSDSLEVFSKLGIYKGYSDSAFVLRKPQGSGKSLRYVLVALRDSVEALWEIAWFADAAVRAVN